MNSSLVPRIAREFLGHGVLNFSGQLIPEAIVERADYAKRIGDQVDVEDVVEGFRKRLAGPQGASERVRPGRSPMRSQLLPIDVLCAETLDGCVEAAHRRDDLRRIPMQLHDPRVGKDL